MCYSVESGLCLLEASEVSEALEVLESAEGDTLCAAQYAGGRGG